MGGWHCQPFNISCGPGGHSLQFRAIRGRIPPPLIRRRSFAVDPLPRATGLRMLAVHLWRGVSIRFI